MMIEERLLETRRDPPICDPGPIIHGLAEIGSVKSVEKLLKALRALTAEVEMTGMRQKRPS